MHGKLVTLRTIRGRIIDYPSKRGDSGTDHYSGIKVCASWLTYLDFSSFDH